ncbi:Ig-like domain-containing protein [Chloroflexota bacterium]
MVRKGYTPEQIINKLREAATLVSLEVTPVTDSIAVGSTQQFTATGSYSDGNTKDITSTAIWITSNPMLASVVPGGLVAGLSGGTVTITAIVGPVQRSATLVVVTF